MKRASCRKGPGGGKNDKHSEQCSVKLGPARTAMKGETRPRTAQRNRGVGLREKRKNAMSENSRAKCRVCRYTDRMISWKAASGHEC